VPPEPVPVARVVRQHALGQRDCAVDIEARGRPGKDGHATRPEFPPPWRANRKVPVAVPVEVGRGESLPEGVVDLDELGNRARVEHLVPVGGEPRVGSVQDVDGTGAVQGAITAEAAGVTRGANREVGVAVSVEVAGSEAGPEAFVRLADAEDPWATLAPELVGGGREAFRGPVQHVDGTAVDTGRGSPDVLVGHAYREICPTIAVEVGRPGGSRHRDRHRREQDRNEPAGGHSHCEPGCRGLHRILHSYVACL
jgi:hypothetical protein